MNYGTKISQKTIEITLSKMFVFLFLIITLSFCRKPEQFPIEPKIEFVSLTKIPTINGVDDKGILTISFTDGDGDVGLSESDTLPPYDTSSVYYYNFFIDYFEKQNGTYTKVNLPFSINSRIPVLNSSGNTKPLKGTIEMELFINNILSPYDTIRFECSICDRALHMSNKIITSDLVINKY